MARPKIVSDFIPDFQRVKKYDRKYITLPYDTVNDDNFLSLTPSTAKLFMVLGIFAFERAQSDGWFPVTMKDLIKKSNLSEKTIQVAKNELSTKKFLDIGIAFHKNSTCHFSDCYKLNGFKDLSVSVQ